MLLAGCLCLILRTWLLLLLSSEDEASGLGPAISLLRRGAWWSGPGLIHGDWSIGSLSPSDGHPEEADDEDDDAEDDDDGLVRVEDEELGEEDQRAAAPAVVQEVEVEPRTLSLELGRHQEPDKGKLIERQNDHENDGPRNTCFREVVESEGDAGDHEGASDKVEADKELLGETLLKGTGQTLTTHFEFII